MAAYRRCVMLHALPSLCFVALTSHVVVGAPVSAALLEDDFNYVVNLDTARRRDGASASTNTPADGVGETVVMRDSQGRAYDCTVPSVLTAAQMRDKHTDERLSAVSSAVLAALETAGNGGAAAAASASAHVSSISQGCVRKRLDYWTYEVCPGRRVSQFRADPSGAPVSSSATFSLGDYDATGDALSNDAFGAVTYAQRYSGGTDGRAATVTFVCEPPDMAPGAAVDVLSVAEPSPVSYALRVGVRDAAACARLPTPAALIRPFNGSCVRWAAGGWWAYSICVGGKITQFHEEGTRVTAEVTLGEYDWRAGEALDVASVGENAAIVQRFAEGTPCDLKGGARRSADVRFECAADGSTGASLTVLSLSEPSTCTYKVVLAAPALCEHPALVSAKAAASALRPTRVISCMPSAAAGKRGAPMSS